CILENKTSGRNWHAEAGTMQSVGSDLTLECDKDYWLQNSTAGNPTSGRNWHAEAGTMQSVGSDLTLECDKDYWLQNSTAGNPVTKQNITCNTMCILENKTSGRNWHAEAGTMQSVGSDLTLECDKDYWLQNSTAGNPTSGRNWHAEAGTMQSVGSDLTLECDKDYWLQNSTAGNPVTKQNITCNTMCILENKTSGRNWHAEAGTMQSVGSDLTLECDKDYWLQNSTAGNPTSGRNWHAEAGTMQSVGSDLTLECDKDYWLQNSTAGNPVTKQNITCNTMCILENKTSGRNWHAEAGTMQSVGSDLTLECDKDYWLQNSTAGNPTSGRNWHAEAGTMQSVGSDLTLECDKDYWLQNSTAGNPVTKQNITCNTMCILENKTSGRNWHAEAGTMQSVGSDLTLECDKDYWLQNSTAGNPTSGRNWHAEAGTMQSVGSDLTLECDKDYWLQNSTAGNPVTKQNITCNTMCILENKTSGRNWHAEAGTMQSVGSDLTLECDKDYWLQNSTAGNPTSGRNWHAEAGTMQSVGSDLTLECDKDYWLQNSTAGNPVTKQNITCNTMCILENKTSGRNWHAEAGTMQSVGSDLTLECDKDYWLQNSTAGNPTSGRNWHAEAGTMQSVGSDLTLECDKDYWLQNSTAGNPVTKQNITCNTMCILENKTSGRNWHAEAGTMQSVGSDLTLECDKDYWLQNSTAGNPAGTMKSVGSDLTLECDKDYWLQNSTAGNPHYFCELTFARMINFIKFRIACQALKTEHTDDSHWHLDDAALDNATVQNYDAHMPLRCDDGYWLKPSSTLGNPQRTQALYSESELHYLCKLTFARMINFIKFRIACQALKIEHTDDSHWHLDDAALDNATVQNYDAHMPLRCDDGYWLKPSSTFGNPQTTQHSDACHWHMTNSTLSNATKMTYDANVQLKCDDGYWLQNTSTPGKPNTTQRCYNQRL
ncbi:hypothetical protein DPMN_050539, partial [Dreissena polymorpha]